MLKNLDPRIPKAFGLGLAIGIVSILILTFATGLAVTSSTANKKAEKKASNAVDKRLAQICVNQFEQSKNMTEKLQKLKEIEYEWDRVDYIKDQGWSTMPDKDSPSPGVADNCAKLILEEFGNKK